MYTWYSWPGESLCFRLHFQAGPSPPWFPHSSPISHSQRIISLPQISFFHVFQVSIKWLRFPQTFHNLVDFFHNKIIYFPHLKAQHYSVWLLLSSQLSSPAGKLFSCLLEVPFSHYAAPSFHPQHKPFLFKLWLVICQTFSKSKYSACYLKKM